MSRYFITPNFYVALNPKAGSSTLARVIIRSFYPEKELSVVSAHYPEGKNPDTTRWQFFCPTTDQPKNKPVVVPIRNPIDRFVSAMAELKITNPDALIDALENKSDIILYGNERLTPAFLDPHLSLQSNLISGESHLFKFPEHIVEMLEFIGASGPVPIINSSQNASVILNSIQIQRIQSYYEKDIALWESIDEPNIIHIVKETDQNQDLIPLKETHAK